ncbi:MAG: deoxyribonuclease IV [Gaiellaceae bacterium]
MLFGAHCSGGVKGAVDRAAEIGADAVQLFLQSPRAWHFPVHDPADLERFRERRAETGLGAVVAHALYLVNLASPDDAVYEKSVATLRSTVETACAIEADAVVFHVGSHLGAGLEAGLLRIVPALEQALELCSDTTWLLLENSAGAGGTIGRSLEELETVFGALGGHRRLGVCLDSCHLFVSGYDVTDRTTLDRVLEELDDRIGLDRLRVLHVNDSKAPLGSNRDRHENIGAGLMGERLGVFLGHPALQSLPAVMEVRGARGKGPDAGDMRTLRELHARWVS